MYFFLLHTWNTYSKMEDIFFLVLYGKGKSKKCVCDSGMRMYALGIVAYLQSAFNRFDCIVIFGSVFEELWINYGHRFVIIIPF